MPLNTLAGQTSAGTNKPKATGFENFQSVMQNMKKQQQPTTLSNFYGLNRATTGNIQGQNQQVNKQTAAQKQLYSDENIKKMMDDLRTKYKTSTDKVSSGLDEGVKKVGTVSFPGSPTDETINNLMDGKYKADTDKPKEQIDADLKVASDDLADGKIDDPRTRAMFDKLTLNDLTGQAEKALRDLFSSVNKAATAAPEPNPYDINNIDTNTDWAGGFTKAATERNVSLEELRKQAIADLLGIDYGIAEDVTPEDTWKGQLNDTNNWEDLAYQQAQLLENPNSTPESVYGALGLSQTGNAYFDALNRSGARSGALNAMQDAKGSTAARDAATQGFTKETTDYMNAMKDIESRWDTAGAATKGELDKDKTARKTGLETKDIGKLSDADITAKAETLAKAEAKAKGIKETNTSNSEYMKLLQKNKDLYGKQVKAEVEAAAKQEKIRKENEYLQKRGHSPESASAIQKAAEESGQSVEAVESGIQRLTDEEVEKYIKAYGDAADNVGVVNKVLGVVSVVFPAINGSGLAALGGLVAQKVLSSKQKKYQAEQQRRKDATGSEAKSEQLAKEADEQNVQDAEAKKAGEANRAATNAALAKSGSIGRASVAL